MSLKMNIASSEEAEEYIKDLKTSIEKQDQVLHAFFLKESRTRSDVSRLISVTEAYNAVIGVLAQIVTAYNDLMEFVEAKSKNILESTFRDEIFSAYLNEIGFLVDTSKEKFKFLVEIKLFCES